MIGLIESPCLFFRRTQSGHPLSSMWRRMSADIRSDKICWKPMHGDTFAIRPVGRIGCKWTGCPFSSDLPIEESRTLTGSISEQWAETDVSSEWSDPRWATRVCQNGSALCERGLRVNLLKHIPVTNICREFQWLVIMLWLSFTFWKWAFAIRTSYRYTVCCWCMVLSTGSHSLLQFADFGSFTLPTGKHISLK